MGDLGAVVPSAPFGTRPGEKDMTEDPITRGVRRQLDGCAAFFHDAFVSLRVNGISGDYVEFGSWGANTFRLAYEEMRSAGTERHLWAFDSFEGLPEARHPADHHPGWQPGSPLGQGGVERFHEACRQHGVPRSAYTAVEGYYAETLPPLEADTPPADIALAYIDCNMYSSTLDVLEFLGPRLKHGMLVGFDDWFCWSPTDVSGERRALDEFLARRPEWHFERYKDIHRSGVSVVVEHAAATRAAR